MLLSLFTELESRREPMSAEQSAKRTKVEQDFAHLQSKNKEYYEKWYKSTTGGTRSSEHTNSAASKEKSDAS